MMGLIILYVTAFFITIKILPICRQYHYIPVFSLIISVLQAIHLIFNNIKQIPLNSVFSNIIILYEIFPNNL